MAASSPAIPVCRPNCRGSCQLPRISRFTESSLPFPSRRFLYLVDSDLALRHRTAQSHKQISFPPVELVLDTKTSLCHETLRRAKLVAFLTRFARDFQQEINPPRLARTALDVGGPPAWRSPPSRRRPVC
jgi:hypothetical protein